MILISLDYRIHFQHQKSKWWRTKNQSQKQKVLSHCQCWLAVCQYWIHYYYYPNQWITKWFSILISWVLNDVECCYRFIAKLPRRKIETFFSLSIFFFFLLDKILYLCGTEEQFFNYLSIWISVFLMLGISTMFWFQFALILILFIFLKRWVLCSERELIEKSKIFNPKNEHYELNYDNKYIRQVASNIHTYFTNFVWIGWLQRVKRIPQRLQIYIKITSKSVVLQF